MDKFYEGGRLALRRRLSRILSKLDGAGRYHAHLFERMARQRERRVLALACGTGRIALPLAGLNVVGVDRSEAMLAVARRKLAAASPSAQERLALLNQDMSELIWIAASASLSCQPVCSSTS